MKFYYLINQGVAYNCIWLKMNFKIGVKVQPVNLINIKNSQITHEQDHPPQSGFSTGSCFLWLDRMNTAFSMNIRGIVNYEYNRLLAEKGLVSDLIPGGEDLKQLGMDQKTSIVRPDLYLDACQKVISVYTGTPFDGLKLTTAAFFDLLHGLNVANSANVRGLINQRYNELLSEFKIHDGKIPGNDLEQLGMDTNTTLKAEPYAKAYGQVIAQFEPTAKYSHCGPFQNNDIFRNSLQFMGYGDLFLCAQVCKSWNKFIENPLIWQLFFIKEKIPFVEKGEKSNVKEEFRILYPRTISGAMGERLFGNFPEELPCISREIFKKFYKSDPFEPEKAMMDTFKIVVFPSIIERTSCEEFPYILDQKGKLKLVEPVKWTGEKLQIPNGIWNQKILCEKPLSGQENMPVFSLFSPDVLGQCNTHPDKISLCFIRIGIVGRNMPYLEQKAFVEGHGFEVVSLEKRGYFNEVSILTSRMCPDGQEPWSHALTSNPVVIGGNTYQSLIGGFAPDLGACVGFNDFSPVDDLFGVAPGLPAEVLR